MNEILVSMLYGMIGAAINLLLIFANVVRMKRFNMRGFSFLAVTLLVGGGFAGIVFDIGSHVFSMLAGYAAVDLLGSIKKSFMRKKIKFT